MANKNPVDARAHAQFTRASLDHCIKCTICETACPVAAVTPLFSGPKFVGPQAERYRNGGSVDLSLDYCSSCGTCTLVCPQGVQIAELNSHARAVMKADNMPLRDRILSDTVLQGTFMVPFAPIANTVLSNNAARIVIEKVVGIHRDAPMPKAQPHKLSWYLKRRKHCWPQGHPTKGQLIYFTGCATQYYEQQTALKTLDVLEYLGYEVLVPEQGCCGLAKQSNGLFDGARKDIRRLVSDLRTEPHDLTIIATSGSCGGMIKHEAREILGVEDEELADVGTRMRDIMEFLEELHHAGELPVAEFKEIKAVLPYHAPCQLKSQGMGMPAISIMRLIPGLEIRESGAACCGIAGTYGVKKEKYEVAQKVGKQLFEHVREVNQENPGEKRAVCDTETCRWQIQRGSGIETVHPIFLVHEALGLDQVAEA